jgi:chromosome segregation ATPase
MSKNIKIEKIEESEAAIETLGAEEDRMRTLYMQDGVIDDTEREALDRIRGKVEKVRTSIASLRAEIERNHDIWNSRSADYSDLQNRTQQLVDFRHEAAATAQAALEPIAQASSQSDQRWADATAGLDNALMNFEPVWLDYEAQKAAKDEYDLLRPEFDSRLADAEAAGPFTEDLTSRIAGIRGNVPAIDADAAAGKWVDALALLQEAIARLEPVEAELARIEAAKEAYETALAALQPRLTDASSSEFATLAEQSQAIVDKQTEMETAATAHDYETATAKLQELSAALDTFLAAREELYAARSEYEATLSGLRGRLTAASSSELASTAELQQTIIATEEAMTVAADAENYEEAMRLAGDLDTALAAYEDVMEDRDLYTARLEAMQDELAEASVSRAEWSYLGSIQSEMATIQTAMETAAGADDFETALRKIAELEGKLVEFQNAIEAKRIEYEDAFGPIQPRLDHIPDCPYPLTAEKNAVNAAVTANEQLVAAEDWQGALDGVASIVAALDAGDTAHQAHDASLRSQINADLPNLRAKADDAANSVLSSASTLRGYVNQLDRALARTDHLTDAIEVLNDAKPLADQMERLLSIYNRLQSADEEDDEALALVNELKGIPDAMNELPQEGRNMLVEGLLDGGGIFDTGDADEQQAIKDIWASAATLDPAFEELDRETTNRIMDNLESDPEVQRFS